MGGDRAQTIPSWASKFFDKSAFEDVRLAVVAAEKKTSGEIVPMIVRRSSTIGHVPILIMSAVWLFCEIIDVADLIAPNWNHWAWEFIYFAIALFSAGLLSRLAFVQRLLVNEDDRNHQVNMRAEVEFYEAGLNETRGATGILIFVSLLEHRVTVLADKAIADKLPPETWNEVVRVVIDGIKTRSLGEGLDRGVRLCGELLGKEFPRPADDTNELHDHLIIKE